jgi:hypothetical protein
MGASQCEKPRIDAVRLHTIVMLSPHYVRVYAQCGTAGKKGAAGKRKAPAKKAATKKPPARTTRATRGKVSFRVLQICHTS